MPPLSPSPYSGFSLSSSLMDLAQWLWLILLATHSVTVSTRPINHLTGLLAEAHVSDRFSAPLSVGSSWLSTVCLYWSVLYLFFRRHNTCTFSNLCQQLKIKSFAWNSRFLTSQDTEDLTSQRRQPHPGCRSERRWWFQLSFLKTPACLNMESGILPILWPEIKLTYMKGLTSPSDTTFQGQKMLLHGRGRRRDYVDILRWTIEKQEVVKIKYSFLYLINNLRHSYSVRWNKQEIR